MDWILPGISLIHYILARCYGSFFSAVCDSRLFRAYFVFFLVKFTFKLTWYRFLSGFKFSFLFHHALFPIAQNVCKFSWKLSDLISSSRRRVLCVCAHDGSTLSWLDKMQMDLSTTTRNSLRIEHKSIFISALLKLISNRRSKFIKWCISLKFQ